MPYSVGQVIKFAMPGAYFFPGSGAGLLACDGSSVEVEFYYELWSVIGNSYGGTAATFNLPNLPGEYICASGCWGPTGGEALGAVTRYATTIVPAGTVGPNSWSVSYLPCDGSLTDQATYRMLFETVHFTYGTAGSSSDKFRVPDVPGRPYHGICFDGPAFPDLDDTYMGQLMILPSQIPLTIPYADTILLPCDGRLLDLLSNVDLFSLINTEYGGDGINNFALPKLDPPGNLSMGHKYYIVRSGMYPVR